MMTVEELKKAISNRTNSLIIKCVLIGLLLIAVSTALPHEGILAFFRDFFRELGIVILTVFSISILYELLIEEKYAEQFLTKLRSQLQEGESNAAACAQMGIIEIFPSRAIFERKYPFSQWSMSLRSGERLFIMARSLFLLMSKFDDIKRALINGASLQLCLFDPEGPVDIAEVLSDMEIFDVKAAIEVFKKKIADWVKTEKPSGKVELRYHRIHLFDSFTLITSESHELGVWDLSFGRDVTMKSIVLVNPKQPLGVNLTNRYELLWERAAIPVFEYDGKAVIVDNL